MTPFALKRIKTDSRGTGVLTAEFGSAAELKSALAHLHPVGIVFDPSGKARYIAVTAEPVPPSVYPATLGLRIREETRTDGVRHTLYLLNSFLHGGVLVRVVEYSPPVEGGHRGSLTLECDTVGEYDEAARFLHEPHGTLLRVIGQADTYGVSVADSAVPGARFPQRVTFDLERRLIVE